MKNDTHCSGCFKEMDELDKKLDKHLDPGDAWCHKCYTEEWPWEFMVKYGGEMA